MIIVKGLRKSIRNGNRTVDILKGLDFTIPRGQFAAVMGASGSGKSTLLGLLAGLDTPSEGSITVAGDALDKMSGGKLSAWRARHIGFVFQLYNLLPVLTAARNVELPLLLTKLGKSDRRKRVEVALSAVGRDVAVFEVSAAVIATTSIEEDDVSWRLDNAVRGTLPRESQRLTGHDWIVLVRPLIEFLSLVPKLGFVNGTTRPKPRG